MKIFKKIFGNKGMCIWTAVAVILLVIIIVADALASRFSGVISVFLGGDVPHEADAESATVYYQKETSSKDKANEQAFDITRRIAEEGTILLRNENGTLPLTSSETKISVFGKNSVNLVYGGSGSGGGDTTFEKDTIFESLEEAGLTYNPTLKSFYENTSKSGEERPSTLKANLDEGTATSAIKTYETPISSYTSDVTSSYSDYKDAAIIVFSRAGGESMDLSMNAAYGANHYLSLDTNEKELIQHVKNAGFGKIIVVLNTLNIVEAGFLEEYGIDACLWIGGPGTTGIMALGEILTGEVTPSGHTTDTWSADFTLDPTFYNFSSRGVENGDWYYNSGKATGYYYVNYEESVYVGYRYYETRAEQERNANDGDDSWYEENVVYPFGYGLSYTTFYREVVGNDIESVSIKKDGTYTVKVKVTNTGSYKGKDVVQVYARLPYENGGVEKPYEVLVGYVKTPLLYPESEAGTDKPNSCTVEIEIDPYSFASYDYKGKSGFKGYVLEEGDYALEISTDAHTPFDTLEFTVDSDITWREDPDTGNTVENLYTDNEDATFNSDYMLDDDALMSREDLSILPGAYEEEDRNIDSTLYEALKDTSHNNPEADSITEMPEQGLAATKVFASVIQYDSETGMYGADYNDSNWDAILNALTVKEMANMFSQGGFKTLYIESVNKPLTMESDGPVGWCNFISTGDDWKYNNAYCSQVVMSATWNTELVEEMGEALGEEALWGASRTEGDEGLSYSGWYAPGVNIHRSPFCGRNFEYFSEDPYLTGTIGAAEVRGCKSKGVYCYVKHFALNEQETHRNGGSSWVTEQAMREIYLKPFEIVVKEGGTTAIMSSFNRIGTRWAGGDYRLLTTILRDEWGFKGTVICDYNQTGDYMDCKQMIYAGGDLNLATDSNKYWTTYDANSASDVAMLRRAAKNIMYTVANSNAINNLNYTYSMAYWKIGLIVGNCVLIAAIIGVTVFMVIRSFRISKRKEASDNKE